MSDEISAAIESSIADLPGSEVDTSVDTSPDVPAPVPEESAETPPDAPPEAPPADEPAAKPLSRSQARIQQLAKQAREWETKYTAREAEHTAALDKLKWATEHPQAELIYRGLQLMQNDPQRFVNEVLLKTPEYQNLIQLRQAEAAQAAAAAAPTAISEEEPQFPEPDIDLGEHGFVHSPQAITKFLRDTAAFHANKAKSEVAKRLDELENEFKPFREERNATLSYNKALGQTQEQWSKIERAYGTYATQAKAEMHAWVQREWQHGRKPTMQDAVEAVLVPKLLKAADDARARELSANDHARERVIADTNRRAAAADRPSAPAGRAADEASSSGDPLIDAINGAIAGLPR